MLSFRASCYGAHLLWALCLMWASPFIQDKKVRVWVGRRVGCHYNIHADRALLPSITIIARVFISLHLIIHIFTGSVQLKKVNANLQILHIKIIGTCIIYY